jgi:hypothetical protein
MKEACFVEDHAVVSAHKSAKCLTRVHYRFMHYLGGAGPQIQVCVYYCRAIKKKCKKIINKIAAKNSFP